MVKLMAMSMPYTSWIDGLIFVAWYSGVDPQYIYGPTGWTMWSEVLQYFLWSNPFWWPITKCFPYIKCDPYLTSVPYVHHMFPKHLICPIHQMCLMDPTYPYLSHPCSIRVGWWISKVGDIGVKWKLLGIETVVVKGFFSKIIILDNKLTPKTHIS